MKSYQDWRHYDPRRSDFHNPEENVYTRGPGAYLPDDQQPYSIKRNSSTYKLFVSGMHPRITERALFYAFSGYGDIISAKTARNRINEPIGFVEFATQYEADNAIIGLNGKGPLYWRVTYAIQRKKLLEDYSELNLLKSEIEEQIQLSDAMAGLITSSPTIRQTREAQTDSIDLGMSQGNRQDKCVYPPCVVCKLEARLVCTTCKTRYCSQHCQSSDWPRHKNDCLPPPRLEASKPPVTASRSTSPVSNQRLRAPRGSTNLSSDIHVTLNADSCYKMIRGIQPLNDISERSTAELSEKKQGPTSPQNKIMGQSPAGSSLPYEQPKSAKANPTPQQSLSNGSDRKEISTKSPQTRIPKVYSMEYSGGRLTLPTVSPFGVVVCFSQSPDKFYFQLERLLPTIENIQKKIQDAAHDADELGPPLVGCPCLALFDGNWYRSQVIQLCGKNHVRVRYVDYGNTAKIANTRDEIRKMEFEYSIYPFFAVAAKLADVSPVENDVWSQTEKEKFEKMVKHRHLTLEPVGHEKDVLCVRLKLPKAEGPDLAQHMIKQNLAKSCGKQLQASDEMDRIVPKTNSAGAASSSSKSRNNSPRNDAIPKTAASANSTDRRPMLSTALPPLPAVRAPSALTNVAKSVPFKITTPPPQLIAIPPPVTSSLPPPLGVIPPPVVKKAPVPVSPAAAVTRPASESNVCQLGTKSRVHFTVTVGFADGFCVGSVIRDLNTSEDLNTLQFDSFASALKTVAGFNPPIGSVVAVFSPEHGEWFRASIVSADKNVYKVIYVDFGNFEDGIVQVKPIPDTYQQQELAVKLSLMASENELVQRYCLDKLVAETVHLLDIVAKEDDFVTATFHGEEFLTGEIKLESWKSLVKQPIPNNNQKRVIQQRQREPGFTAQVIVVVVEDFDNFYVLFYDDLNTADEIQTEIRKKFTSCPSLSRCPSVGSHVIALFPEDGDFYRAQILSIDGQSIHVRYIDFGNSATVSLKELKVLPDKMFEYAACATRITLNQVPRTLDALPANVRSHLDDIIQQQFTLFVVSSEPSSVECVLIKDDLVLNDLILELMESAQQCNSVQVPESTATVSAVEDVATSASSKMEMPQLMVNDVTEGEVQVDNSLVSIFYDKGSFIEFPEEGEFQALVLSSDQPECMMMSAADETTLSKMDQLQEDMRRYSEGILLAYVPKEGEICIVRSSKDKLWYRAAVLEPTSCPTELMCILVDYGTIIIVASEHIRKIPKRFVDYLPFVAQQAVLKELQHIAPEDVDKKLVARISALLPEKSFITARVVGRNDHMYVVEIPSISKILLDEGLLK